MNSPHFTTIVRASKDWPSPARPVPAPRAAQLISERRQSLLKRRDELQDESLGLTREISDLQTEKAGATEQADKDRLDARIAAKTTRRDEVDKRIEQINEELKTLNAPSGDLQATEAQVEFSPEKLPKSSAFDDAFKEAARKQIEVFNSSPKLNTTLRLENFLQMQ
jgi:predicted translin family RNA/ssDNA-binding protein